MTNSKRIAKRRDRLFAADPHCAYCGQEVVSYPLAPHEVPPGNYATAEHVYSRNGGPRPKQGRIILACQNCNEAKGIEDYKAHQGTDHHLTARIGDLVPALSELFTAGTESSIREHGNI